MILKVLKYTGVLYVGGMLGCFAHVVPFAVMGEASFHEFLVLLMLWPARLAQFFLN